MTESYQFKPSEQPFVPGASYTPQHPRHRTLAYGGIGILAGLTSGLANALVTANLPFFQGTQGLSAIQTAWIPAVFVMTNVCANLLLVKFRQEFGLGVFSKLLLAFYVLTAVMHLVVHGFWSLILIRAASGLVAAGLTAMSILALIQAFPPARRMAAVLIGISLPQLATPLARALAPALLQSGDWRMAYLFEVSLALLTLASLVALPLPPGRREHVFEAVDFLTIGLLAVGLSLLCVFFGLGPILWWTASSELGWAAVGAVVFIASGLAVEHGRARPLLTTRWMSRWTILRVVLVAAFGRLLISEQSFGSIGLLTSLGMGGDQYQALYTTVTLASVAGLLGAILMFRPRSPARPIQLACVLITVGAFLDAGATNQTTPAKLMLSQALIGAGALLFIGPAMVIGVSRTLLAGKENFVSWIVLFGASQNLGGLVGTSVLQTFQIVREKFHSHNLVEQIVLTNPIVAGRLSGGSLRLSGVVDDPLLRNAEGAVLLAQQIRREANILAFNDVFLVIAALALCLLAWSVMIDLAMRRRGEVPPTAQLLQRMAGMSAAKSSQGMPA